MTCAKSCLKLKTWFSGYFSQLLISLILLFILRPYDRGSLYLSIWQVLFFGVFLSAIFNCNHSRRIKVITSCFALPAVVLEWILVFYPLRLLTILFLFLTLCFIAVATYSIIARVVIDARVKLETLRGVICAYFMLAFGFAFAYFLIEILVPGSFHFSFYEIPPLETHGHFLSEMMYFSFVTLLCIGYGDIIAVKDVSQTLTILEGIMGQFYIAILVARLVAVYSFFQHKLHLLNNKK